MRWTLGQLAKMKMPFDFEYEIDFTNSLEKLPDVKKISISYIKGTIYSYEFDNYIFSINIKTNLTMQCAVTLEDIEVPLDINCSETFVLSNEDGDDVNIIENDTIDLDDVVLANVILSVPMKVVKEGAENIYASSDDYVPEAENPFKVLENYFDDKDKKKEV